MTADPPADSSERPTFPHDRAYEGDVESSGVSQSGPVTDEGAFENSGVTQMEDGSAEGDYENSSVLTIG